MSLAERLSAIEDYESLRELSPGPDRRRKLSYNPLPAKWVPPEENKPTVGAYEVTSTKRAIQVACAVIYCLFAAGIVFGFAAIKPIFIHEQVYRESCTKDELEAGVSVCYKQELRLNFMFTVAAVATNVAALPIGAILDKYGPRACGLIGGVFVAIGCLLLAFAWSLRDYGFDAYIPGYMFLALGGPFVFISSFQLSNTFPKYSGLILALLTGSFDTSSAIFLFYRLIYSATEGSFYPKKFFLSYLVVPLFIILVQSFVMPSSSYKSVGELVIDVEEESAAETAAAVAEAETNTEHTITEQLEAVRERRQSVIAEITDLLGSKDAVKQANKEHETRFKSGVWGALHGESATRQILSAWFILITLFTVVQMTRINYFVATIRSQYEYLLDSREGAIAINDFFDIALPLGGVVAIPFIGVLLDSLSTATVLGILVAGASAIGILGVIPQMWAGYANVCLFVVYRPFYYTCVSDYAAKVFGFHTFGKVYGLIICLAGLFNFLQTPLDAITHKVFDRNPVPINLILLGFAFVVGTSLTTFVWKKSIFASKDDATNEVDESYQRLLSRETNVQTVDYGTV